MRDRVGGLICEQNVYNSPLALTRWDQQHQNCDRDKQITMGDVGIVLTKPLEEVLVPSGLVAMFTPPPGARTLLARPVQLPARCVLFSKCKPFEIPYWSCQHPRYDAHGALTGMLTTPNEALAVRLRMQ